MDQVTSSDFRASTPLRAGGFTLVELLTVIAVIAALLAIAAPAFTKIAQGTDLTRAGQDFADALILARDEAQGRNRKVVVRLIQQVGVGTAAKHYRGIQIWATKDDAGNMVALGKIIQFPNTIVFAENEALSPLLKTPPAPTGTMAVSGVTCNYVSFTINARGTLDTTYTNGNSTTSFLTIVQEKDVAATSAPKNFVSVYLNPATGQFSTFRP